LQRQLIAKDREIVRPNCAGTAKPQPKALAGG
jgi:hypothetical protein